MITGVRPTLHEGDVAAYLVERRLVPAGAVLDGSPRVVNRSRRNRALQWETDAGGRLLVKQAAGEADTRTLAHEAAVYEFLASASLGGDLRVPALHSYDAERDLLVLELVPGEDLRRRHVRTGRFSRAVARATGRALAALHGVGLAGLPDCVAARRPAALMLHRPTLALLESVSAANVAYLRLVQEYGELVRLIEELRADWRTNALVHGDLRWDNILVSGRRDGGVTLVDWEFANVGDWRWDVASLLADYVGLWVAELGPSGDGARAAALLARMRPAMDVFWSAYAERRGLETTTAIRSLGDVVRFLGVVLLERGAQELHGKSQLSARAVLLAQVAFNVLQRPDDAAHQLLGIRSPAGRPDG
jgi:aminoglycoside phosphotransferase (APT) family kinase protein